MQKRTHDSSTVLPHEKGGSDKETLEEMPLSEQLTNGRPEPRTNSGDIVIHLDINHVDLFDDVRVTRVELTEEAQILDGFLTTATSDQPTRRFPNEEGDSDCE